MLYFKIVSVLVPRHRHNMYIERSVLLCKEHLKILYFLTCIGITCDMFLHFSRTLILSDRFNVCNGTGKF